MFMLEAIVQGLPISPFIIKCCFLPLCSQVRFCILFERLILCLDLDLLDLCVIGSCYFDSGTCVGYECVFMYLVRFL